MNHGRQVRIVEVEHVGRRAVYESRRERIQPLAAPDDRGLRGAAELFQNGKRVLDGGIAAAAERGAEEIEQGSLRLVAHRRGNVLPPRVRNEAGERGGDFQATYYCRYIPG